MRNDESRPQGASEEYLATDFSDGPRESLPSLALDRRGFLQLVGGGILVAISTRYLEAVPQREGGHWPGHPLPEDFNAFLRIGEDGRVTGYTGKIEMGQGVITSLPQMLAEELDVPLESVDMMMGDTDLCPWDMGTFGSMSTRIFGPAFRAAAGEARAVLIDLAAEKLQVARDRLKTKAGVVYEEAGLKKVTYAELAKGQKILRHVKGASPEAPSQFTLIGKPTLRRDAVEKVTGRAKYAGDIREPGLLHARLLRPPAHGAKLTHVEVSAAREIPGVQVIQDGDLVAVLHEAPDVAEQALASIKAQYDRPAPNVDDKTIFDHLLKVAPKGQTVAEGGNLAEGQHAAPQVIEQTYLNSYVSHATIETHTALAKVEGGKVTVWASTQTPFALKEAAASLLSLPAQNVHVITPFVGGGFGGKSNNQQALEAVRLAKLVGKPVQVMWTRAEEFFYDTFRPAAIVKINAGVTDAGLISFWDYGVYFAGERGAPQFYNIPHHRTVTYSSGWNGGPGAHPFATGPWRAPANNTNTFARESHIDALAAKASVDPIEFRMRNLKDERMRRVLQAAADKFGWTPAKAPSGRGYGVACGIDAGTYVAHIAEVAVHKDSGVKVKRVVCAQDMGLCVNPEGAKLQMEGAITMGLGYALTEEVQFQGGDIRNRNFDSYELPRFSWVPEIETIIIDAKTFPAQGGGEPAIICMGGLLANAVFDATGVRLLQLPMTLERVKAGMPRGARPA
jgi:isoquinoline 1-oxidoreductase